MFHLFRISIFQTLCLLLSVLLLSGIVCAQSPQTRSATTKPNKYGVILQFITPVTDSLDTGVKPAAYWVVDTVSSLTVTVLAKYDKTNTPVARVVFSYKGNSANDNYGWSTEQTMTLNGGNFTYSFNPTAMSIGRHRLKAQAYNSNGGDLGHIVIDCVRCTSRTFDHLSAYSPPLFPVGQHTCDGCGCNRPCLAVDNGQYSTGGITYSMHQEFLVRETRNGISAYGHALSHDSGSKITGAHMDLWMESRSMAVTWGSSSGLAYVAPVVSLTHANANNTVSVNDSVVNNN